MKYILDARWIYSELSGIGSHTRDLVRHLAATAPSDEQAILLFSNEAVMRGIMADPVLKEQARFEPLLVPWSPFSLAGQLFLPRLLRQLEADLYHSTNYMIPLAAFPRRRPHRMKCIITVHDMIPLKYPHFTPRAIKTRFLPVFRWLFREVCARTDAIITVSECSRRDVIGHLRLPPARQAGVCAIHNGVDARFAPPAAGEPARDPVILYVGRLDPYKNVSTLLHAFAGLAGRHPGLRLRIVGPADDRYPDARRLIDTLHLAGNVDWNGYLSDEDLLAAYRRAALLVLPSSYEGFGLPVVEAMASGTPVVCSDAGSLPEIAADAALLVPPADVPALEEAMQRILATPALAADLTRRGLRRAADFNWEKTARQTRALYQRSVNACA